MNDKDKIKDPKHLQNVIDKMVGELSSPIVGVPQEDPLEYFQQLGAHLEQGMMELYQNISMLGQMLDLARLQNFMLTNILVDKGICTKEELQERYKTEVEDELKKQQELMRIKLEEEIKKADQVKE